MIRLTGFKGRKWLFSLLPSKSQPQLKLRPDQLEEELQILKGQRLMGYKTRKKWGHYLLPFS